MAVRSLLVLIGEVFTSSPFYWIPHLESTNLNFDGCYLGWPDHNLQDVRAKIFPFKRRKVKAPEVVLPVTLPVKRKERSLSSLVVSTPRVSTQTTMTGRRTKSVARKATALRGSGFSIEKLIKKEEDSVGERPASSSSPETLNKFTQNIRQNSPSAEPSIHSTPNKETENGAESWEGKFDLWKPLNCLVEVANRTKSLKFNSQGSAVKSEPMHVPDESVKPKKLCRVRRRRAAAFGELGISPQAVLNAVNNHKRRTGSIWFSLVASEDQEGDASLPQISSNFLRIK
ncbi:E3 ubiquitin protein ligase DRIP1 [Vitis vinifera]|uniref:E3 ubiquitin protein ligase DRIP1 n=1 Tax=Vitis vinifera TaxID=29760 RepID=A0A438KGV7_VITVI|nr:E3 ubiquitin protein ligase DRIP1 [Vitis vinifera]